MYSWIKNSSELIASGDEQAVAVFEQYNKSVMTAFPYFTNDDIDNILAYIKAGPAEIEEVVVESSEEVSSSSNPSTILTLVLVALVLFAIVLARVKNVLKEVKGDPTASLLESAIRWLKATPVVIGLVIFYIVLTGLGTVWDGLLTVGVQQGYNLNNR